LEQVVRRAGLKATRGRLAVLQALEGAPHADAEAIYQTVRQQIPTTSIQSVHNILGDFTRVGLARRIEPAHSPALYERRVGDNHHHLVCRGCGIVHDVDCVVGAAPCLTPSDDHGFQLAEAEVTFWGLCPTCSTRTAGEPG
jgi:Fur family ferric uptake transcriptional regulator